MRLFVLQGWKKPGSAAAAGLTPLHLGLILPHSIYNERE
jgi:hypothetical protein